jgi:hypothetical protein
MLRVVLHGADIPDGFLDSYQVNFRFPVFETASAAVRMGYSERVKFKRVYLDVAGDPDLEENKIGGNPSWLLEDESPGSYAGKTPMFFLLQLLDKLEFEINTGTPRQIELGLLSGGPRESRLDYYKLFIGNRLFLFGTENRGNPVVYAIPQVD